MNEHATAYDSADRETHEYGCAECRSDCDCPLGKYCQGTFSEADDFGTCVSYKEKLNKPCNPDVSVNGDDEGAFYGDKMACAIFIDFDIGTSYVHMQGQFGYNLTHRMTAWKGSCIQGYCKECNSWMLPNPRHYGSSIWYTGSVQDINAARTLQCLETPPTTTGNAYFKHKPYVCDNFQWKYVSGYAP